MKYLATRVNSAYNNNLSIGYSCILVRDLFRKDMFFIDGLGRMFWKYYFIGYIRGKFVIGCKTTIKSKSSHT